MISGINKQPKEANVIVQPVHYDLGIPFPEWGPDGLKSLAAFLAQAAEEVGLMRPDCGLPENVIVDPPEHRNGYSAYPIVFYLWFSGSNPDFYSNLGSIQADGKPYGSLMLDGPAYRIALKIKGKYYRHHDVSVILERGPEAKFVVARKEE